MLGEEGQKGQAMKCLLMKASRNGEDCEAILTLAFLACHRSASKAFSFCTCVGSIFPVLHSLLPIFTDNP